MNDAAINSLSYKELQALAMSLNLPGKMKQAVLLEAIKARKSGNESAVNVILEANRQRRIIRRQQQQHQQHQQQQRQRQQDNDYLKHNDELAKKRCFSRRLKRSASEVIDVHPDKPDSFKKSKSVGSHETCHRRPLFHNSTGSISKDSSQWTDAIPESFSVSSVNSVSSINSSSSVSSISTITSVFPDMAPTHTATPNNTTHMHDDGILLDLGRTAPEGNSICSWTTVSGSDQLEGFEGYDNDWLSEETYDLSTWKSLPNVKIATDASGNSLQDADPAVGTFEEIFNSLCRPDELPSVAPVESAPTPSFYPESLDHRLLPDYFGPQIPHFRLLRPGNPTSVTVSSGQTTSDVTFCNTFSRVAAYVQ